MSKKSVRFIARDLFSGIDEVREAIDDLGIEPDGYSYQGTPTYNETTQMRIRARLNRGIDWYCDECDECLNDQPGFSTRTGTWVCTECGFENDVTEINMLS